MHNKCLKSSVYFVAVLGFEFILLINYLPSLMDAGRGDEILGSETEDCFYSWHSEQFEYQHVCFSCPGPVSSAEFQDGLRDSHLLTYTHLLVIQPNPCYAGILQMCLRP